MADKRINVEDHIHPVVMELHTIIVKATEVLGKRKVHNSGKHNYKPWFATEVKTLAILKMRTSSRKLCTSLRRRKKNFT